MHTSIFKVLVTFVAMLWKYIPRIMDTFHNLLRVIFRDLAHII